MHMKRKKEKKAGPPKKTKHWIVLTIVVVGLLLGFVVFRSDQIVSLLAPLWLSQLSHDTVAGGEEPIGEDSIRENRNGSRTGTGGDAMKGSSNAQPQTTLNKWDRQCWPGLCAPLHYRAFEMIKNGPIDATALEHLILKLQADQAITILFVGGSITAGIGATFYPCYNNSDSTWDQKTNAWVPMPWEASNSSCSYARLLGVHVNSYGNLLMNWLSCSYPRANHTFKQIDLWGASFEQNLLKVDKKKQAADLVVLDLGVNTGDTVSLEELLRSQLYSPDAINSPHGKVLQDRPAVLSVMWQQLPQV